jgi:hypothetical protein
MRSAASSIWSLAAAPVVTSSIARSESANSPSRQPRGTFRAVAILPRFGDLLPARLDIGQEPGHRRIHVEIILVPRRDTGRRLLAVLPGTGERDCGHERTSVRKIEKTFKLYEHYSVYIRTQERIPL